MDLHDQTILILGDLVSFPTVTSESNLDLIDYAAQTLEPLGYDLRLTHDESGLKANLLATTGPPVDGGIVLSGHTDVVPVEEEGWTGAPFVAMRREEKIYGRGTVDMKGFIACALALAPHFASLPLARPVHIALTFDEEVGCRGAPLLIADMQAAGFNPSAAIVGEPTETGIVVAHKGIHEYTTHITGLEGHGSRPAAAVNAVQFGARYVTKLMDIAAELEDRSQPDSPYDPPASTISVGSMHGGVAHNIVAGECLIQWEMRPVTRADATHALDTVVAFERQLREEMQLVSPEADIVRTTEGAVGGLEDDTESHAFELLAGLLGDSERQVASYSTEAGLYQEAGISSVVCGPGSIGVAHRPDEYVGLDQLEKCLELMKSTAGTLLD